MVNKRVKTSFIREEHFPFKEEEATYIHHKECKIVEPKFLLQDKFSFSVSNFFNQYSLLNLISLSYPFHSKLLYNFFHQLLINFERIILPSHVYGKEISIMDANLYEYLYNSTTTPSAHSILFNPHYN